MCEREGGGTEKPYKKWHLFVEDNDSTILKSYGSVLEISEYIFTLIVLKVNVLLQYDLQYLIFLFL